MTPPWAWGAFLIVVLLALALDLGVAQRGRSEMRIRDAVRWTIAWVAFAALVGAAIALMKGQGASLAFVAGYLVEESLSVDNLFVFVMIFAYFKIPRALHHRVLFYGVLGALVMRGLFIGFGVLLFSRFQWIGVVFGVLLVITGIRTGMRQESSFDASHSRVVRWLRRLIPMTDQFHGARLFVREAGRRMATPLLLVLALVEITDVAFAIDSIPATFGVTRDPFLVFTSNICAVLGLRALYGVVAAAISRFALLRYGVAVILAFIGVKMMTESFIHIDIGVSLGVIVAVLLLSTLASLRWPRAD